MYSPHDNRFDDRDEIFAFMRRHSFAALVTDGDGGLRGSHLPSLMQDEDGRFVIEMHMARANDQWRQFGAAKALVIFSGPDAYISPRWYEDKERVPTWNYAAVHAYGRPALIEERKAKHASQRRLVAVMDPQWLPKFDALREEYVSNMLAGIVNFEIAVTRIETRWKLSQNRGRREQELIAEALERSGSGLDAELAALTRRHLVDP